MPISSKRAGSLFSCAWLTESEMLDGGISAILLYPGGVMWARVFLIIGLMLQMTDSPAWASVPSGYEVVDVVAWPYDTSKPQLNRCGEIVAQFRTAPLQQAWEILLFADGELQMLTSNNVGDIRPSINDQGTVLWERTGGEWESLVSAETEGGERILVVSENPISGVINSFADVAYSEIVDFECNGSGFHTDADVLLYDGIGQYVIYDNEYSNQSVDLNDSGDMVWTEYAFACSGGWTSRIVYYADGAAAYLPLANEDVAVQTPQLPKINGLGSAVWQESGGIGWANDSLGSLLLIADVPGTSSTAPDISDDGSVVFVHQPTGTFLRELRLLRDGVTYLIADNVDGTNSSPAINTHGEVAWLWDAADGGSSKIRYMRRARTGDRTLDGFVGADDLVGLAPCVTGVGGDERLCDCRFFDLDEDRDVDLVDLLNLQVRAGGATREADDCCLPHGSSGCGDAGVEACVCAALPECCSGPWTDGCTVAAQDLGCDECLGPGKLDVAVVSGNAETVRVRPGALVAYRVIGTIVESPAQGLAGIALDLELSDGEFVDGALVSPELLTFTAPAGLANPGGFGGTTQGLRLVQVGGIQNTLGEPTTSTVAMAPALEGGVVTDIAQKATILSSGWVRAPLKTGAFTLNPANITANVLMAGPGAYGEWQTGRIAPGGATGLTVIVEVNSTTGSKVRTRMERLTPVR